MNALPERQSHDAAGDNAACEATACGANEKVIVLVCVECPARKISSGSHDVPGSNTASSPLRVRQMQRLHVCMECLARKTSTGSQDAKDDIDFLDTHGSVQRMAAFEQSSEK